MKRLALLALGACVLLLALAHHQDRQGLWGWVAAFAEAAVVGALADWFAVVALFRRPLGLPFPHTAILPRRKPQLADQFAVFVRDRFLDTPTLLARLAALDPLSRLGQWLAREDNARQLATHLQGLVDGLLGCIDDARIRSLLQGAVTQRLERLDLSHAAGDLLDTLTAQGRHQQLFEQALLQLADHVDSEPVQRTLASVLLEIAGQEYPLVLRTIGLVTDTDEFGRRLAAATARGLTRWVHEVCEDPDHPRRQAFDRSVAELIERLRDDPDLAARLNAAKDRWLHEPVLQDYVRGLWDELRDWLQADLASPQSRLQEQLAVMAGRLGQALGSDPVLRAALQDHLLAMVEQSAPSLRELAAAHIARTVRSWHDEQLVQEIELAIGRDLQFIRLNGTLVGGLIGLALHALAALG
jgi:uncharacterized membrane-anchored protein YjiN (DUF445 family)